MGVKDFFKKVGRGIGKFAGKVWNGVKKVGGVVGKIAKPVLGVMSHLPGIGGTIGRIGGKIVDGIKRVVDLIPNKNARDKLNQYTDKGRDIVNKTENVVDGVGEKLRPWVEFGNKVMKKLPILHGGRNPDGTMVRGSN